MNTHSPDRRLERLLIAAGIASITSALPEPVSRFLRTVSVDPHAETLVRRSEEEEMLPMLARTARTRKWRLARLLRETDCVWTIVMQAQYATLISIAQSLSDRSVDTILLKGADHALSLYPPDLPRTMLDIELLVHPPHLAEACTALSQLGFIQGGNVDVQNLWIDPGPVAPYRRMNWNGEAARGHMRFIRLPALDAYADVIRENLKEDRYASFFAIVGGDVYVLMRVFLNHTVEKDVLLTDVWNSTRTVALPDGPVMKALGATTLLWYLSATFYHDFMIAGRARLIHFIDIVAAVYVMQSAIEWDRLLEVVRRYNLEPSLFYTMTHVNAVLGPCVPKEFLRAVSPGNGYCGRLHDWGDFVPRMLGLHSTVTPVFDTA